MEIVKVYSPVEDKNIKKNLNDSPVWKQAYHIEELAEARLKHAILYEYSIKFNGLKAVQVTDIRKVQ